MEENELLASRYGQRPGLSRRVKVILGVSGVGLLIAAAGLATVANFSPIGTKDISFTVIGNSQIELEFEISKPKDATAICSFEALNEQYGQVGYKQLEIGAQQTDTVRFKILINTTELATTALVDECVLK